MSVVRIARSAKLEKKTYRLRIAFHYRRALSGQHGLGAGQQWGIVF
jgi:hypothetical protein